MRHGKNAKSATKGGVKSGAQSSAGGVSKSKNGSFGTKNTLSSSRGGRVTKKRG